jgi:hypothetical protein
MTNTIEIGLLDGSTVKTNDRKVIECLWKTDKVSLVEAASCLTILLNLHPSNAHRVWAYLEKL